MMCGRTMEQVKQSRLRIQLNGSFPGYQTGRQTEHHERGLYGILKITNTQEMIDLNRRVLPEAWALEPVLSVPSEKYGRKL